METDDQGTWLSFAGVTSSSGQIRFLVTEAGEVTKDPEGEPQATVRTDGRFGPYPFTVKSGRLYDTETGAEIVDLSGYKFEQAWEDGSRIICGTGDYYVVIRYAEPAELRRLALEILGDRQMTDEQRKQYFLAP